MSLGREIRADDEFIDLLYEAQIDPSWILNENVKAKLMARNGNNTPSTKKPKPKPPTKPAEYRNQ